MESYEIKDLAGFRDEVNEKCGAYLHSRGYRTMLERKKARQQRERETGELTKPKKRMSDSEASMRRLESFLDYKAVLDAERA
jgi:hypothetical protein